jgi:hypothetical protein
VVHLLLEAQNLKLVKGPVDVEVSDIKRLGRCDIIDLLNLRPP